MTAVATKSGRPFTLPKKPIDRYEVTYFYVGGYGEDPYLRHVRCVYHENSTWAEVCPSRAKEDGGAFVTQWQIFIDGRFDGRTGKGWHAVLPGECCFGTWEEAKACAVNQLRDSLALHRDYVNQIERRRTAMQHRTEESVKK